MGLPWSPEGAVRAVRGDQAGDTEAALRAAEAADECWKSGEPWQYGVWSLVRIGAATAHVMESDVQAAETESQ